MRFVARLIIDRPTDPTVIEDVALFVNNQFEAVAAAVAAEYAGVEGLTVTTDLEVDLNTEA